MRASLSDVRLTSRLHEQAAFDFLRTSKIRWVSKGFAIQAAPCSGPQITVGFCVTASKKTAKSAVSRNRMRRRIKPVALEILGHHAQPTHSYMLIARREALTLPSEDLRRDLIWCLKKLGLYRDGS